ncbi:MAG: NtrZ family periplasmic regulatory protein [Alphaproteobacteria bacterium]
MRVIAALFVASSLISAPAFAQVAKDGGQGASAGPNALSSAKTSAASTDGKPTGLTLGYLDRFAISNGSERPVAGLAPIEKDQLDFAWRPGGKWGLTIDLTTRAQNNVLPREELQAGAYYQVTPRFRFGGGVMLKGDSIGSPDAWKAEQPDAGVRLSSAFSF